MSKEHLSAEDPRIQSAASELRELITKRYPEATFRLAEGEDPEGVYLTATVDTDDLTEVLELVGDRLVDLQVEAGLPLYLVPVRPWERVLEALQRPEPQRWPRREGKAVPPAVNS